MDEMEDGSISLANLTMTMSVDKGSQENAVPVYVQLFRLVF